MKPGVSGVGLAPSRSRALRWVCLGLLTIVLAAAAGAAVGPVSVNPWRALLEILDWLPFVSLDSGLDDTHAAILRELRIPRVVLGLLVGGMLGISGAAYQGVFRNPLADPYLLGIAAGAGLGATLAIIAGANGGASYGVEAAAFLGALAAVGTTVLLGSGSVASLLLAGVAVASFFTAVQTYLIQREWENFREVYTWILGRLSTSGWSEVLRLLPYAAAATLVMMFFRNHLDVLSVGDDEAATLGLRPRRIRLAVVLAASLATSAAVATAGLIGFVGLIVPHGVRLLAGVSNRVVLPLSLLFGGAFLTLADLLARTLQSPAELPIGVVTAFVGAPFFLAILRSRIGRTA